MSAPQLRLDMLPDHTFLVSIAEGAALPLQEQQLSLIRQLSHHFYHAACCDTAELYQFSVTNLKQFSRYWNCIIDLTERRIPQIKHSTQQGPTTLLAPLVLSGGPAIWSRIRNELKNFNLEHLPTLVKTIAVVRSYAGMIQPYPDDGRFFDKLQETFKAVDTPFTIEEAPPAADDVEDQFAYLRTFGRANPSPHLEAILKTCDGEELTIRKCIVVFALLYYTDCAFAPTSTRDILRNYLKSIEEHPDEADMLECNEIVKSLRKIIRLLKDFQTDSKPIFWDKVKKETKLILMPLLNMLGTALTQDDLRHIMLISANPFDMRLVADVISRNRENWMGENPQITRWGVFSDNMIFQIPGTLIQQAFGRDVFAACRGEDVRPCIPEFVQQWNELLELPLDKCYDNLCIMNGMLRHVEMAALSSEENKNCYQTFYTEELATDVGVKLSKFSNENSYHRTIHFAWSRRSLAMDKPLFRSKLIYYSLSLTNRLFFTNENTVFLETCAMLKDYGNTVAWYRENRARVIFLLTNSVKIEQLVENPVIFPNFMNHPRGSSILDAAAFIYLSYFIGEKLLNNWVVKFVTEVVRYDSALLDSSFDEMLAEMNKIGWSLKDLKNIASPTDRYLKLLRAAENNPVVLRRSTLDDLLGCAGACLKNDRGLENGWKEAHELIRSLERKLAPKLGRMPGTPAKKRVTEEAVQSEIEMIKKTAVLKLCTIVEMQKVKIRMLLQVYAQKQKAAGEEEGSNPIRKDYLQGKTACLNAIQLELEAKLEFLSDYFRNRISVDSASFAMANVEKNRVTRLNYVKRWLEDHDQRTAQLCQGLEIFTIGVQHQYKLVMEPLRYERDLKFRKVEVLAAMGPHHTVQYEKILEEYKKAWEKVGMASRIQSVLEATTMEEIDHAEQNHDTRDAVHAVLALHSRMQEVSIAMLPKNRSPGRDLLQDVENVLKTKEEEIQRLKQELAALTPAIPPFALNPE